VSAPGRIGHAHGHGRLPVEVAGQLSREVQPDDRVRGPGRGVRARKRTVRRPRVFGRPPAVQRPRAAAVEPVDPGLGHQQLVHVGRGGHHHLGAGHGGAGGGGRRPVAVVAAAPVVLVNAVHQAADDLRQPHLAGSVIVATAHHILFRFNASDSI